MALLFVENEDILRIIILLVMGYKIIAKLYYPHEIFYTFFLFY